MRRRLHLAILYPLCAFFGLGMSLFLYGLWFDRSLILQLGIIMAFPFIVACIMFGKKLFQFQEKSEVK